MDAVAGAAEGEILMSDLIYREDAKDFVRHAWAKGLDVIEYLDEVPAADVRPVVRAHWYWDKDGMDWGIGAWRCSACHSRPETWWQGDSNSPRNKSGHYFCPNCGADMREKS